MAIQILDWSLGCHRRPQLPLEAIYQIIFITFSFRYCKHSLFSYAKQFFLHCCSRSFIWFKKFRVFQTSNVIISCHFIIPFILFGDIRCLNVTRSVVREKLFCNIFCQLPTLSELPPFFERLKIPHFFFYLYQYQVFLIHIVKLIFLHY